MLNYKPLDLEYKHVAEKILNYLTEFKILKDSCYWHSFAIEHFLKTIPEFQEMFDSINLTVIKVAVLCTQGDDLIHVDTGPETARINIPLLNCENTFTRFFENHGKTTTRLLSKDISYTFIDPNSCTLIEQFTLTQPTVIRVDIPHQVLVPNPTLPRIVCTVFFKENIDYLLKN